MEIFDPLILEGGSPPILIKKKYFLFRFVVQIILFLTIIFFIIHIPDLPLKNQSKEEVIQEIKEVLMRNSKDLSLDMQEELARLIYEESTRYSHDPKFILALIAIESSFQNRSVSEKGAKGLMQLMPFVAESIAKELGIEWKGDHTLFNPFLNIKIGIYFLSQLVSDFNDIRVALIAYNYGPTYVKELVNNNKKIPYQFTKKVFSVYQTL